MTSRKLAALIIWWCEGTKLRKDKRWKNSYIYSTEVTNTNPEVVKIFLDYLVIDLKFDLGKVKGQLQIHEGDNQKEFENYWSQYLKLPIEQFNKTIVRPRGTRQKEHTGTFKLRIHGKQLFSDLQILLDKEIKGLKN